MNYQIEGTPSGYDDSLHQLGRPDSRALHTAGMFTAKAQFYYAVNSYRDIALADMRPAWNATGEFEDTKLHGGFLSFEFKFGKATAIAGAGYQYMESDSWSKEAGYNDDNTTRFAYFLALPYEVHKNFTIWPEFGYWDSGDSARTGDDQGNTWLLGRRVPLHLLVSRPKGRLDPKTPRDRAARPGLFFLVLRRLVTSHCFAIVKNM